MKPVKMPIFAIVPVIAAILCTACSEKLPDGMPKLYPVSVKITQDGAPLADASVSLVPNDPNLSRWPVAANTDASGTAKLYTYGYPGCPEGSFKVTVTKTEATGGGTDGNPAISQSKTPTRIYWLVEKSFRTADTTPLSLEVKSGKNAESTFDVGKPAREEKLGPENLTH
ncbi:MAG: carboxypeptidase regulatory-like domain-containing protein [Planctomycetia bacterium]|nr:carboxypeptidase regulatory-like domain-containing protein [Planctomycetia bacterium]